jgi:hypothetical protein
MGQQGQTETLIVTLPTGKLTISVNLKDDIGAFDLIQLNGNEAVQQCTAGNDFVRVVRRITCNGVNRWGHVETKLKHLWKRLFSRCPQYQHHRNR